MPTLVFGTIAIALFFLMGKAWLYGYLARVSKLPHNKKLYTGLHRRSVQWFKWSTILLPVPLHMVTVLLRRWVHHPAPPDLIYASLTFYVLLLINYLLLWQVDGLKSGMQRQHLYLGRCAMALNLLLMGIGTDLFFKIYR